MSSRPYPDDPAKWCGPIRECRKASITWKLFLSGVQKKEKKRLTCETYTLLYFSIPRKKAHRSNFLGSRSTLPFSRSLSRPSPLVQILPQVLELHFRLFPWPSDNSRLSSIHFRSSLCAAYHSSIAVGEVPDVDDSLALVSRLAPDHMHFRRAYCLSIRPIQKTARGSSIVYDSLGSALKTPT